MTLLTNNPLYIALIQTASDGTSLLIRCGEPMYSLEQELAADMAKTV
jgi:hypothetical protein